MRGWEVWWEKGSRNGGADVGGEGKGWVELGKAEGRERGEIGNIKSGTGGAEGAAIHKWVLILFYFYFYSAVDESL
ncbi:hypothetical protein Tco_0856703 [Tanacetum coccineum]|uniref:Uncharacterized protein n=1 Tax=Tanacetum coccineum TaxID=301880 RepID=A0ABQ5B819_9ASTR